MRGAVVKLSTTATLAVILGTVTALAVMYSTPASLALCVPVVAGAFYIAGWCDGFLRGARERS